MKRKTALYIFLFALAVSLIITDPSLTAYFRKSLRDFNPVPTFIYTRTIIAVYSFVVIAKFALASKLPGKLALPLSSVSLGLMTLAFAATFWHMYFAINYLFIAILWAASLAELVLYRFMRKPAPEEPLAEQTET